MTEHHPVVTAHQVARSIGVSQSAVSRAFTPGASIAPNTRKRILLAAEELGYQPNLIARSLTSGRSNIVGVGIGNLENPFFTASLNQLSIELSAAGLRLLLFTADPAARVDPSIQEVLQYRLDALILLSTTLTSTLAAQCHAARIPIVLYNRVPAAEQHASSVTGNNVGGARVIASFLAGGAHRRIAFIRGMVDSSTSRDRERGFLERLAELECPPPSVESGDFTYDGAAAATRRLLSQREPPDAIFCANDQMALATINVVQAEFGLEVGRQLSVVGFDDVPMAAWPCFSLTTFSQPVAEMARATVAIIRAMADSDFQPITWTTDGSLIVRGSARRPRIISPATEPQM